MINKNNSKNKSGDDDDNNNNNNKNNKNNYNNNNKNNSNINNKFFQLEKLGRAQLLGSLTPLRLKKLFIEALLRIFQRSKNSSK